MFWRVAKNQPPLAHPHVEKNEGMPAQVTSHLISTQKIVEPSTFNLLKLN